MRILGGALPTPSEALDHRFGLRDYAMTYTGLFIMENAIQHDAPDLGNVAPPSKVVPNPAKPRRCVSGQRLKVKLSRMAGRSAKRVRVLVDGRARKAKVRRVKSGRLVATVPLRPYRGKKISVTVKRRGTTVQKRRFRICL